MSMQVKFNHEHDTERILYDAMDNICQYLGTKELCSLSKVCKSWRGAALRETAKRCFIQQLRFSYNVDNSLEPKIPALAHMLSVKPYASLMIYDKRLGKSQLMINQGIHSFYEKMLIDFKKQLPNNAITLEVCEYLTTEDVTFEGTKDQCELELTGNCGILGLFIPSVKRRASVHVAWARGHGKPKEVADRIIEKLDFHDYDRPKSTVLLFAHEHRGYFIAEQIVETLGNRFDDGKDTIWGADFGPKLVTGTCYSKHFTTEVRSIVALRIAGPNVESWTTIIDCSLRRDEIEQKLYALKEKVTCRRYYTGLLYAPQGKRNCRGFCKNGTDSSQEILRIMKRIFPDIPFVGLFNRICRVLPSKSVINEYGTRAIDECMSIIIISYD